MFVLFWIGFFIFTALGSAFDFLGGNRDNEFAAIIVFYGGLAIVIFLIVVAFMNDLVAFK